MSSQHPSPDPPPLPRALTDPTVRPVPATVVVRLAPTAPPAIRTRTTQRIPEPPENSPGVAAPVPGQPVLLPEHPDQHEPGEHPPESDHGVAPVRCARSARRFPLHRLHSHLSDPGQRAPARHPHGALPPAPDDRREFVSPAERPESRLARRCSARPGAAPAAAAASSGYRLNTAPRTTPIPAQVSATISHVNDCRTAAARPAAADMTSHPPVTFRPRPRRGFTIDCVLTGDRSRPDLRRLPTRHHPHHGRDQPGHEP